MIRFFSCVCISMLTNFPTLLIMHYKEHIFYCSLIIRSNAQRAKVHQNNIYVVISNQISYTWFYIVTLYVIPRDVYCILTWHTIKLYCIYPIMDRKMLWNEAQWFYLERTRQHSSPLTSHIHLMITKSSSENHSENVLEMGCK